MRSDRRRTVVRWAVVALGLLLPTSLDQVSEAFILSAPASCVRTAPGEAAVGRSCRRTPYADRAERQKTSAGFYGKRYRGKARSTAFVSFQSGMDAAGSGGPDQNFGADEELGMAPVDLEQTMGSLSPEWGNDTVRDDPKKHLIKGSVIAANQTAFPYSINSFPPLTNSEVYYNGTRGSYWWNQNADAVCVYVPVPEGFDPTAVEFVAKTKAVSLKLGGKEILSGTPFYRIDGYDSLFVVDSCNDPPYVQLELFKVREYQNWEDLLLEDSTFKPAGAQ